MLLSPKSCHTTSAKHFRMKHGQIGICIIHPVLTQKWRKDTQSSAVITRSNITWYCTHNCNNWGDHQSDAEHTKTPHTSPWRASHGVFFVNNLEKIDSVITAPLCISFPVTTDALKMSAIMAIHYDDVIMGAIASQITSLTIVYSTVYSDADHGKHESSASLAFVRGIHRGPVNSPHKWPVTRKMFPFHDVIMIYSRWRQLLGVM